MFFFANSKFCYEEFFANFTSYFAKSKNETPETTMDFRIRYEYGFQIFNSQDSSGNETTSMSDDATSSDENPTTLGLSLRKDDPSKVFNFDERNEPKERVSFPLSPRGIGKIGSTILFNHSDKTRKGSTDGDDSESKKKWVKLSRNNKEWSSLTELPSQEKALPYQKLPLADNPKNFNKLIVSEFKKQLNVVAHRLKYIYPQELSNLIFKFIDEKANNFKDGFMNESRSDIETNRSPRIKSVLLDIKSDRTLLQSLYSNLQIAFEELEVLVCKWGCITDWIKNVFERIELLKDSQFNKFRHNYIGADKKTRKILNLVLGRSLNEVSEIMAIVQKWEDDSNKILIGDKLKGLEDYYFGLTNIKNKKYEVSSEEIKNVFLVSTRDLIQSFLFRKVFDIPLSIREEKIVLFAQKDLGSNRLRELFGRIFSKLSQTICDEEINVEKELADFFTYNHTRYDHFVHLYYLGACLFPSLFQRMFPLLKNKNSNLENKCGRCDIQFEDFRNFKMHFFMDYRFAEAKEDEEKIEDLQDQGRFNVSLLISLENDDTPSVEIEVIDYFFSDSCEKQKDILDAFVHYAPPCDIHTVRDFTKDSGNKFDKEVAEELSEKLNNFGVKPILLKELEDFYQNICRKEIEEGEGSPLNIQNILLKNDLFFEYIIPRTVYLNEELKRILVKKGSGSTFTDQLTALLTNIIEQFNFKLDAKGSFRTADVKNFFSVLNDIKDSKDKRYPLIMDVIGGSRRKAKNIIERLKKRLDIDNINKTLKRMRFEQNNLKTDNLSASFFALQLDKKACKEYLYSAIAPFHIVRSYAIDGKIVLGTIYFNNKRINLPESGSIEYFNTLLGAIYSKFDPGKNKEQIELEVKLLVNFVDVNWDEVATCFYKKRGGLLNANKINWEEMEKNFPKSIVKDIDWKEIRIKWKKYRKHNSNTPIDSFTKRVISWFTFTSIPCYHLLVLGANGAWSLADTLLKTMYEKQYKCPLHTSNDKILAVHFNVENKASYNVATTKSMAVYSRLDRWKAAKEEKEGGTDQKTSRVHVDSEKPIATFSVTSLVFPLPDKVCRCLIKVHPPYIISQHVDFYNDPYRVLDACIKPKLSAKQKQNGYLVESMDKKSGEELFNLLHFHEGEEKEKKIE